MKTRNSIYSLLAIVLIGLVLRYSIGMEAIDDEKSVNHKVGDFRKTRYVNHVGDTVVKVERLNYTSDKTATYWDAVETVDNEQKANAFIKHQVSYVKPR